jgi:hypothetical protein
MALGVHAQRLRMCIGGNRLLAEVVLFGRACPAAHQYFACICHESYNIIHLYKRRNSSSYRTKSVFGPVAA